MANKITKKSKKNYKAIGARILVILLAATFILSSLIYIFPSIFG